MHIAEFLDKTAVTANLEATNKPGVLRELVGLALKTRPDLDPNVLVDTLLAREKLQSTGIGDGYAIPHGKTNAVPTIIACVGRSVAGVDFQSHDGKPTHLFFTLLVPESSHALHLKALARVSRLIRDAGIRQSLLETSSSQALYDIIVAEDARL
ncbi:PTS sugar transporter subunit IIA [Myxococcota bacterium]|jgi:PTS system nitrogen regulatory IIA component|nr:PTS sugar transporter subunit IIA [Myxococcota bacterium]